MIASPALSPLSAVPILGSAHPGEPAESPTGADFLTILTQSAASALPASNTAIDPASVTAPALPAPGPAVAAATTGKILPPTSPLAALSDAALPAETAPTAEAATGSISPAHGQSAVHRPVLPRGQARKVARLEPAPARDPACAGPEEADKPDAIPEQLVAALTLPTPALAALTAHAPPQPGQSEHAAVLRAMPALTESPTDGEAPSAPQGALPALAARVEPRRLDAVPPIASQPPQAAARPSDQPAPQPLTQVRLDIIPSEASQPSARAEAVLLAQPLAAMPRSEAEVLPRSPRADAAPLVQPLAAMPRGEADLLPRAARAVAARPVQSLSAVRGDKAEAPAPAMLPMGAPQPLLQPLLAGAPAAPLERPQDFTALIDRLAAAREAAAPHSVSVSLPHADFGRVQLHFRQEDGALAVSLASADPDFARIAAQSAPPSLAVSEPRSSENVPQGQSQSATARSDGQGATSSGSGNARGQNHERRGDGQAPFADQPRARAAAERRGGRSGIFA